MVKLKKYTLGELIDVRRGASLAGEYYATEGELMRLTLGHFDYQGGGFKDNTSKSDLFFTGPVKQEFILCEGDIITPLTEQTPGLLGSTAMIPESDKYIQSQDVALITPDESKLDRNFCYYLLPSKIVKQQLAAGAQQTKIRHTTPDRIKDLTVFILSLPEQKAIGKLLKCIDQKIALNREINRNLEAMARQLYDYWFVQFDFPDENGRPYKSSGGKMVWNEKLKREIPDGWSATNFEHVCQINRGASPRPIDEFMDETHQGMPRLKISDATSCDSPFIHVIKEHIIEQGIKKSVTVLPDTLIVSNSATPGIPKFMGIKACVHDGWLVLTKYSTELKYYLFFAIQDLRTMLINTASGSVFKNLKTDYLKQAPLISPPKPIIDAFHVRISSIMDTININTKGIIDLQAKRDELLPLLMNGQVSVMQPELNCDLSEQGE